MSKNGIVYTIHTSERSPLVAGLVGILAKNEIGDVTTEQQRGHWTLNPQHVNTQEGSLNQNNKQNLTLCGIMGVVVFIIRHSASSA